LWTILHSQEINAISKPILRQQELYSIVWNIQRIFLLLTKYRRAADNVILMHWRCRPLYDKQSGDKSTACITAYMKPPISL